MTGIRSFYRQYRKIFLCFGFLLLLYSISRLVFWVYNRQEFQNMNWGEVASILYRGIQQDLLTLILVNAAWLFLFLVSAHFPKTHLSFGRISKWIFILGNSLGFALNILDIGYFRYSRHRANLDLLFVFPDSISSFGSLFSNYWWLLLLLLFIIYLIYKMASWLFSGPEPIPANREMIFLFQFLFVLLCIFLIGGFRKNKVLPSTPLLSVEPLHLPIAQNSIYTLAYSILRKQQQLSLKSYFPTAVLDSLVKVNHTMTAGQPMQKKNIVICILESFNRGYLLPGDPAKAKTPFLDSLIRKSTFFPNAFANGYSSNQGIVSILGGLPPLLDEPFYYSTYANTALYSIGNILKENGYNTNFLMGANPDHFGFEKFSHMAGIDQYYSRADFNDDRFYDGNWGIFDEPFLQYGASLLAKKQEPFFAVFFNISSHPPFTIPKELAHKFSSPDQSPEQNSISYVDYAFGRFFETCQNQPWFRNTLFVFCADHYLAPGDEHAYHAVGSAAIPLFMYAPADPEGRVDSIVAGQVDITPLILQRLHYTGIWKGFGHDFSAPNEFHYVIGRPGQLVQIISGDFVLGYDPVQERTNYFYQYRADPELHKNLVDDPVYRTEKRKMEDYLKASIQRYNQSLIRGKLE